MFQNIRHTLLYMHMPHTHIYIKMEKKHTQAKPVYKAQSLLASYYADCDVMASYV